MRPEAFAEAQDWLLRAQRELLAVERALSGEPVLGDQAAFHSQQAAEKALKAFLTAHDYSFAKTHNLERLVRLCKSIDPAREALRLASEVGECVHQRLFPDDAL
jgi:HEPN domain-containing protein